MTNAANASLKLRGFISQGSLLLKKTRAFKEEMTDFLPKCSQLAETVELCEFTVNGTGRCYEYVLILKSNNCKSDPITHAGGKRGWSKTPRVFLDKVETKPSEQSRKGACLGIMG